MPVPRDDGPVPDGGQRPLRRSPGSLEHHACPEHHATAGRKAGRHHRPALLNEAGHVRRGLAHPVTGQPAVCELRVGRMRLLDVVERRGRDLGRDRQGLVRGLVLGRRYAAADYAGDRNNRYCLAVPAADLSR